jgi:hypothetical protein
MWVYFRSLVYFSVLFLHQEKSGNTAFNVCLPGILTLSSLTAAKGLVSVYLKNSFTNLESLTPEYVALYPGSKFHAQLISVNKAVSCPGAKLHNWEQHYKPGNNITNLGTKLRTWVQNYVPGYKIKYLGTKFYTRIQYYIPENQTSYPGAELHAPVSCV